MSPGDEYSLIGQKDSQPVLFSVAPELRDALANEGHYTADRLFRDHQEIYEAVVAMLAERRGPRAIKRAIKRAFNRGIHHDTIDAVAKREKIAIDTLNERIIRNLGLILEAGTEVLLEKLEGAKPGELAMTVGVAFDKLQLATGGATMRLETSDITPSTKQPATFDQWLAGLKQANKPGMGLGGGEKGQIAEAGEAVHELVAPAGVAIESGGSGVSAAGPERGTDGLSLAGQSERVSATTRATAGDPGVGSVDQGEGGVVDSGGGPAGPTHPRAGNFEPIATSPAASPDGGAGARTGEPDP